MLKCQVVNFKRYFSDFYTRKPLNYETFSKRIHDFNKLKREPNEADLIDCIRAGRRLQMGSIISQKRNFLKLKFGSNKDIERKIWGVLNKHKYLVISKDAILKAYLTTTPIPIEVSRIHDLITENLNHKLSKDEVDMTVVRVGLSCLLSQRDYHNCFKLLEKTCNSERYISYQKHRFVRDLLGQGVAVMFLLILEAIFLQSALWIVVNSISTAFVFWGLSQVKYPRELGRLSWRPYKSLVHKVTHFDELSLINIIITYFEEHSEVNIKNFHHSEVRDVASLLSFRLNDYIIELPQKNLTSISMASQDPETLSLQRYFRRQLSKRQIVLNELPEEKIILEYWLDKSDKFEWVEPDQDPAEIVKLKIGQ
ncbi:uncharacterized protein PRCAT00006074001 [Priceomyces carsonii]|uniref:uncharacterized protein n=1 Tax=Priceomyces carsonii TaxID=28549 RepID=UPI002EDAD287|nr:unnamed protein product [Priceomyces carsonii]